MDTKLQSSHLIFYQVNFTNISLILDYLRSVNILKQKKHHANAHAFLVVSHRPEDHVNFPKQQISNHDALLRMIGPQGENLDYW